MPFVVGVLTLYLDEVKQMPLEEVRSLLCCSISCENVFFFKVSIINLDSDTVEVSLEDISMLPSGTATPQRAAR